MKSIVGTLACIVAVTVADGCALDGPEPRQPGPEHAIVDRMAANTKTTEREWRFTPGICDCPLMTIEELGTAIGMWERSSHDPSSGPIFVTVHTMADAEAAFRLMLRHGIGRHLAEGWRLEHSDLPEAAYIAFHELTRRYQATFRKGRFLASVSSSHKTDVERFAKQLLAAISEIG
jgi:hypothetical protein